MGCWVKESSGRKPPSTLERLAHPWRSHHDQNLNEFFRFNKDLFPLLKSGIFSCLGIFVIPLQPGLDVFNYRIKGISCLLVPCSTSLGCKCTSIQYRQVLQKTLKALNLEKRKILILKDFIVPMFLILKGSFREKYLLMLFYESSKAYWKYSRCRSLMTLLWNCKNQVIPW